MSISDWSSDVCSSDLSGLRVLAAGSQLETPTGALHDQPRQGHCDEQEVDGPAVDEQRLTDDGDVVSQRHRDQIGRASCCERVCYYVFISLVSFSLIIKLIFYYSFYIYFFFFIL